MKNQNMLWWCQLFYLNILFISSENVKGKRDLNHGSNEKLNELTKKIDKTDNRDNILSNLENKLLKAAKQLSSKEKKHIQLIIKGIKLKMQNVTKLMAPSNLTVIKKITGQELIDNIDRFNRSHIVYDLSIKIESLLEKELEKLRPPEKEKNILKKEIIESISLHLNSVTKTIRDDSRRMSGSIYDNDIQKSVIKTTIVDNDNHNNSDTKTDNKNIYKIPTYKNSMTSSLCLNFYSRTCENIKSINRLKCRYELGYTTLDKLCDGNSDCPFRSDENDCFYQVTKKVELVQQIMAEIESYNQKCVEFHVSRSILCKQSQILRDALASRLNFKHIYNSANNSLNVRNFSNEHLNFNDKANEKRDTNEIFIIISSLAIALDGALCSDKISLGARKSNDIFQMDLENDFRESVQVHKNCKCKKELCVGCTDLCKRICQQKFNLAQWNCESLSHTASVSLNFLCDGKMDCLDESDESDCVTGSGYAKFEAHDIYKKIHKMLQLKATKEHQQTQKDILYLSNLIIKLQKYSTESVLKLEKIKEVRDKCFLMLKNIYSDVLKQSYLNQEAEDAYLFLMSINENLGNALKRSHTGNNKIIGNECYCRNGACSISFCSKLCIKACAVEPKLLRYHCKRHSNKSVTLDKVCDGIQDCSDGYDEFYCKKDEICRPHHVVVLRHKIQNVGEHLEGTALGEQLASWKTKVISTLKIVEKNGRTSPQMFKNVINDILRDLVITYGAVGNYRRSTTDYAFGTFLDISQSIIESLKSCRK